MSGPAANYIVLRGQADKTRKLGIVTFRDCCRSFTDSAWQIQALASSLEADIAFVKPLCVHLALNSSEQLGRPFRKYTKADMGGCVEQRSCQRQLSGI
jgi:hypothetical protein